MEPDALMAWKMAMRSRGVAPMAFRALAISPILTPLGKIEDDELTLIFHHGHLGLRHDHRLAFGQGIRLDDLSRFPDDQAEIAMRDSDG